MSDIEYANRLRVPQNPRAPQGPSDAQLNAIPPDPYLPPFGGSASLFADLVTGPYMDPGRATSVLTFADRAVSVVRIPLPRQEPRAAASNHPPKPITPPL